MTEFKRRIRPRRKDIAGASAKSQKTRLEMDAARLGRLQVQLFKLQAEIESATEALRRAMRDTHTPVVLGKQGYLEVKYALEVPATRSTTHIDAAAYRKLVSPADFLDSVKVSVTKAKEYLGEKELASVSKVVPGETKPAVVNLKFLQHEGVVYAGRGVKRK